jgi:hypothetical protein
MRCPSVPPGLARIVDRMLAKKPADRFQTPFELLSELRELAKRAAQEGWAEGPDNWSLSELLSFGEGRNEATQRLADAMKTTAMATIPRWRAKRWAGFAIGALVFGSIVAALTQPRLLLAGAEEEPPAKESVRAQLFHAKVINTPEAWQAVEKNWRDSADSFDLNLAKQGLARLYLQQATDKSYENAEAPLRELALDPDPAFKSFGLAGQVIRLTALHQKAIKAGDTERAARYREDANKASGLLTTDLVRRLDPEMARRLEEAQRELARM